MQYKFLIYISYRYSIPIGEPLEKEILKRGDIVKWFADEHETYQYLDSKKNILKSIHEAVAYQPHIVLTATNMVPDFISGLKVQIFHGFNAEKRPSKKNTFSHFRIRGFFDLYCTQGPSTTSIFKQQQKKHPHFEVIETGWSKVDPLFPVEKIEHDIPRVLIATTFTPRLSLAMNKAVFEEIKKLSKTGKYHFTMVTHPKLDKNSINTWKTLEGEFFNYLDTVDLIPLLKENNVLLADTTSVIQEFLVQKKPVVSVHHTSSHPYLIHVNDPVTIKEKLDHALTYPNDVIQEIDTFVMQLHPYFDGKSSQRIIDASIGFLHQEKTHLKTKPVNLIRKFKIRKKLGYFTFKSFRKPFTISPD